MLNSRKDTILFLSIGCLALTVLFTSHSKAQTTSAPDTAQFQFWYSTVDARSAAMANALVADRVSSNGLYTNPALLPFNEVSDLSAHTGYNTRHNIVTENVTASLFDDEKKKLFLGGTLVHNSPANIVLPNGRQLNFTQYNFDVAYGQMLTSSLSMGIKLNANYGKTKSGSSYTTNTSLGVIYAPSAMISYGLVYKGTGYQNSWLGSGLFYYRTTDESSQITTKKLPQRLEIGATLRFPSLAKKPDFTLSFSNEKLFGKPGLVYRGGIEIYLLDKATVRGGYFHSTFIQGGRLGFGLIFDPLKIHYAYRKNNLDLNGRTHLLSISLDI